jgi:hypothetical protein
MTEGKRVVYKYTNWQRHGKNMTMAVPIGDCVHVAPNFPMDDLPALWVEHWIGPTGGINQIDLETYVLHGTGHQNIEQNEKHVGSCVAMDGQLVWHVYKRNE